MKVVLRWLDIAVYLAFLAFALLTGVRTPAWFAGLGMAAITVPFWFAARWQLGRSFSVGPKASELVTRGLYSKIRHPVYVFGGVAWTGALIVLLGWKALAIGVIIGVVEVVRARREDQVLGEAFGAQYEEYKSMTWF